MKPPFVTTGSDNHVADHNHLVTIAMVLVFA